MLNERYTPISFEIKNFKFNFLVRLLRYDILFFMFLFFLQNGPSSRGKCSVLIKDEYLKGIKFRGY